MLAAALEEGDAALERCWEHAACAPFGRLSLVSAARESSEIAAVFAHLCPEADAHARASALFALEASGLDFGDEAARRSVLEAALALDAARRSSGHCRSWAASTMGDSGCSWSNLGGCTQEVATGITQAAATVGGWLQKVGTALQAVANLFGFVGTNFQLTAVLQVLQGNFQPAQLWQALGQDWSNFQNDATIAESVPQALADGDYTKAYNLCTDNGQSVAQFEAFFQGWTANGKTASGGAAIPPPGQPTQNPAFAAQADAIVGAVAAGTYPDPRAGAQLLYDNGWYESGDSVVGAWQASLVNSPLGAAGQAAVAQASGNPVAMLVCAQALLAASVDPTVLATWTLHDWGSPAAELAPLAAALTTAAQAAASGTTGATGPAPAPASTSSDVVPVVLVSTAAIGVGAWLLLGRPASWAAVKSAWHALVGG